MIKERNGFQYDPEHPRRRFKGGGSPKIQPSPIMPTKVDNEVQAAQRDIEERRRITKGRAASSLTMPSLVNTDAGALKKKLGTG